MPSWLEDFRGDVAKVREFGMPSLILHGTADNILPIDSTGREFTKQFPEAEYIEIDGAPHGMLETHYAEVNAVLLEFLAR